jgi:ribonuclease HI
VRVYSDGGARGNPGPAAFAFIICSEDGRILKEFSRYIGKATNNEAEYKGLIAALSQAEAMGADEIGVTMDSEVVVKQMTGEYQIKAENLKPLAEEASKQMSRFKSHSIAYARREHPMIAKTDMLVNEELEQQELLRKLR